MVVMFCLHTHGYAAPTQGKPVSLTIKNSSLAEVLRQVSKKSGLYIYFQDADLAAHKSVTLDVKNKPVENVLHELLDGRGFSWVEVSENTIAVKKNGSSEGERRIEGDTVSTITVTGRVVDEKGEPIMGATVIVKGTKIGATTNVNGEFLLSGIRNNAGLVITSVSYVSRELAVNGKNHLGRIALKDYIGVLDETVVIAYGTTTKRYSTGNIGGIKAREIEKQPVNNPLLALQGRVPGVFVSQSTGVSGGEVNVTIQGKNSLLNSNDPFYVVDGVPYPQNNLPSISGSAMPGISGSALSFINPADIESIEILKDADATAIYGSRAANGAILITTKKGVAGPARVSLNAQTGWGKVTRKLELLDTKQYLDLRKEAYTNDGLLIPTQDMPISQKNFTNYDLTVWDPNKNTDWQDVLVGGTATYNNYQASIAGGTENTQFLTGANYLRESTVYPGNLNDKKISIHFSLNHNSTNRKFRFGLSGSYLKDINTLAIQDLMALAVTLPPNAPELYNSDGTLNWGRVSNSNKYSFTNPLSYVMRKYTANTNNLISNAQISYEIFPGLELKSSFGYNKLASEETNITPLTAIKPDAFSRVRRANYSNKSLESWIVEPQVSYNKNYDFGRLDALIGATFQNSDNSLMAFSGSGYANDAQLYNIRSAPVITVTNSIQSTYRYSAIFGRVNYRLKDRYVVNITARRDGSSRFGARNLFHDFYAIGGAWVFSEEGMIKKAMPFLSSGKIRASFGTTGNDQIGDYRFLNLYDDYGVDIPYQGSVGLVPQGLSNPYLQWEETRKTNVGLDLSLLKEKIIINANYFLNRSSNQLLFYSLPVITGSYNITQNLPAVVQNSGWEILVSGIPLANKAKLNWETSINITIPRNKLVEYPGISQSTDANTYVIGQSINIQRVYPFRGVNQETGLYEYTNSKGVATSAPEGETDKTALVNIDPKIYGGFLNKLKYGNWELDLLFQFVKQTGRNYRFGPGLEPGYGGYNQATYVTNRWQKIGDISNVEKSSTNIGNPSFDAGSNSNAAFSDASYVRLKNLSLSYSLPTPTLKHLNMSQARVYVQGQNLITFTQYFGLDPETLSSGSLPPLRVFTFGFQVTF
jgi:TonB-linked SusC/RagA family outer membrane protein